MVRTKKNWIKENELRKGNLTEKCV